MANAKKGIKIIAHGEYYFKTETTKGRKPFSGEYLFPSLSIFNETIRTYKGQKVDPVTQLSEPDYDTRTILNIRGLLKKRFLPILLQKQLSDFARVRYVSIDEVIALDGQTLNLPLALRSRKQLRSYLDEKSIPINVDQYLDIDELRNDIQLYLENPDVFLREKPMKDKLRADEEEFARMNGLTAETDGTLAPRKERIVKPTEPSISEL